MVLGFKLSFSQELHVGFILFVLKGAVLRIAGDGLKPPKFPKSRALVYSKLSCQVEPSMSPSISAVGHVWTNSL